MTHRALDYTGCRDLVSQIIVLAFIHNPCASISVWNIQHQFGVVLQCLSGVEISKQWPQIEKYLYRSWLSL